jgi:hypothetical protein
MKFYKPVRRPQVSCRRAKMRIIRKVPPQKPNKVMKIATYWILFLGQTIGDVTILYHLISAL